MAVTNWWMLTRVESREVAREGCIFGDAMADLVRCPFSRRVLVAREKARVSA
jgi:hypothetical protein